MTCPFKLLTFTSLGGTGGSCSWRRGARHFFAGRNLWWRVVSALLLFFAPCSLLRNKFSGDQYIDDDIITLLMKGLCPFNSGEQ